MSLLCVWILLVSSFGSEYGELIQCVPLVCRSLSAFLLSVCMSVWSMSSICMSPIVCCLFLKWYVDSREVLHLTSAFIFFGRVCRLPSVWMGYCLWHLCR